MISIFKKLFDTEYKELKRFNQIATQIEALDEEYSKLSDKKLAGKTAEFKKRLDEGETLEDVLDEAFATIREAAYRIIGEKAYFCQLLGGLAIHYGNIAEMKTGEGKTLTTIFPAYVNALTGLGVHVVTVNEYLTQRNAEWMGPIFEFLGLTVGVNLRELNPKQKQEVYNCDIMYTTNNELGFDSLPNPIYLNSYTTTDAYLTNKYQHAMVETNGLYNNLTSNFVIQDKPWIIRDGLFSYNNSTGINNDSVGTRTVLIIK